MKKLFIILIVSVFALKGFSQIDMQEHVASNDGKAHYTTYVAKQNAYYTGTYAYTNLVKQSGTALFGTLNALMGSTCKMSGKSYDALRNAYIYVDKDLNNSSNIIGFYDGSSFNGKWDSGKTWNREHVWPQSKGADSGAPMGHDMQAVRPALKAQNSDRGNTAYGENGKTYDPDDIKIDNPYYKSTNMGTYRGDCARIILYDYVVYGSEGSYKNSLYNGSAQLYSKLSASGVFESAEILLKWHMQDPPSLTEMVRNDGGQQYQGNRNPWIDYPELAIQMLKDKVKTYPVTSNQTMQPNYTLTTKHGFVAYLTDKNGNHPSKVQVAGANVSYDKTLGRLVLTNVTGNVSIVTDTPTDVDMTEQNKIRYYVTANQLVVSELQGEAVKVFDITGKPVYTNFSTTGDLQISLPNGVYILQVGQQIEKIML